MYSYHRETITGNEGTTSRFYDMDYPLHQRTITQGQLVGMEPITKWSDYVVPHDNKKISELTHLDVLIILVRGHNLNNGVLLVRGDRLLAYCFDQGTELHAQSLLTLFKGFQQ